jgi:peroxiredoxin
VNIGMMVKYDPPVDGKDEKRPKRYTKKQKAGLFIAFVIIVLIIAIIIIRPFSNVGNEAPNFNISDIDGNKVTLSDYRGKVVVLDLMATWCGPCITEMGHLKEIYNKYNSSEVVIMSIGIDEKESEAKLRQFKNDYGDDWIFARDIDGVEGKYGVEFIPTLVIIDKNGIIAYENVGVTSSSTLSEEIDKLL